MFRTRVGCERSKRNGKCVRLFGAKQSSERVPLSAEGLADSRKGRIRGKGGFAEGADSARPRTESAEGRGREAGPRDPLGRFAANRWGAKSSSLAALAFTLISS